MPSKAPWLAGLFPALVTSFAKRVEAVDEAAFRRLIRHLLPEVDGLVTTGTTGEFPFLFHPERRRLRAPAST